MGFILMCRRKDDKGKQLKHHGTAKESTSKQQRFDWTEIITFSLRKNGGYMHYVVVQAVGLFLRSGRLADKNLIYENFKIL